MITRINYPRRVKNYEFRKEGKMNIKNKFLFLFILFSLNLTSFDLRGKNTISIGIDYNSLLYEFDGSNIHSFYYNLGVKGYLDGKNSLLNYNFSLLYPFSHSYKDDPLKIAIGNLNFKRNFNLGLKKDLEFFIFFNFRNSEESKKKVPVEEETFNLYGFENAFNFFKNLKIKFGLSFLKTKNYEIFQNNKTYIIFKFKKENNNLKYFSDFSFSRYYFDQKILTIPMDGDDFPIPELKTHNENVYSFDLGMEYFSSFIFDFILFFQKKDSTIKDFSNKSIGLEGLFSFNLIKDIDLILALRYEKRHLQKKYLFFEPNILTDIGTSYIYLKLKKNIDLKRNLSLVFGRFVHDAREEFFKTENARYKISLSISQNF